MREEEELIADAQRSLAETERLREETGLGTGDAAAPESPAPEPEPPKDPEPWAKTSSGDAEHVTDDDTR
jgi:hypothetical protein